MNTHENVAVTLDEMIRDAVAQKRVVKWGYVRQFGGLYPSECDSVAAHSNAVAVLAILLAGEFTHELSAAVNVELNLEDISLMATFHDYGEGRSGDTGASSYSTRGYCNLHSIEREGLERSLRGLRLEARLLRLWDDYRAYKTPEAVLVHIADNLEGFEKALHAARGSREIIQDVFRIVDENIAIYNRRGELNADLGLATFFLLRRVLLPGLRTISSAYDLGPLFETLEATWELKPTMTTEPGPLESSRNKTPDDTCKTQSSSMR